ncbi:MAG: hypothetical protein AAGG51_25970 [Cyanobacteria bacterium P01_G01_bin.54]
MMPMETVSRFDLRAFGLSDYLIRQLTRGLTFNRENRFKVYSVVDLLGSVSQKLAKPRTMAKTRMILENLRLKLQGESNVIRVEFGQPLAPHEEVQRLQQELVEFNQNRQQVLDRTDQVLSKAKRMIAKV